MSNLPTANEVGHLCYVKTTWAQAWQEAPLLVCQSMTDAVAPSHSTATFSQTYGTELWPQIGSRPADQNPTQVEKPDLLNKYVKVETTTGVTWYGVIVDVDDEQGGTLDQIPTGQLTITAIGLTFLLERSEPINKTFFKTSSGIGSIDVAIPFNAGTDGRRGRDRTAVGNYDPLVKVFTDKTRTVDAALWTAANAFEYLIDRFSPVDVNGSKRLPLHISEASKACLSYELARIDYAGSTIWQALNAIVDRRRGLLLYSIINQAGQLELVVDTGTPTSITLPSNANVPANRNQRTYSFDDAIGVESVQLKKSAVQQYDQVLCRGEKAGVVCTLTPKAIEGQTVQMIPDWQESEQTAYNDAASNDADYSTLSDTSKAAANADIRATDEVSRVYSWWRLDTDWNGYSHNVGTVDTVAAFGVNSETGLIDTDVVADVWPEGLRFADFMPLRPQIDYTGDVTPATDSGDQYSQDYLPPAVFIQLDPIGSLVGDDGWVHAERLNAAVDSGDVKREYQWSVQLIIRDDVPGIILQVVGGQQHYLAQDLYVSNGTYEDIPSNEGVNHKDWLATVYLPLQFHVFAKYPQDVSLQTGDMKKVLTLQIPDAWLDWLAPGTVVSVKSGELQQTNGGWLRDDRQRLEDIARLAFEWYSQPRQSLSIAFDGIVSDMSVGQMVTAISQGGVTQTVNTVVTSVQLNLQQGTTNVTTSFVELDFVGLV